MTVTATDPQTTRRLADFAVQLRYEDLPDDIVQMAKRCILDSIGCGIYGSSKPWTESVMRVVESLGQARRSSAWGMRVKADPTGAALINGTAAQGFELDDCHDQSMSHYGAAVVPAVLAIAEGMGDFGGKQIIIGVVVGYELGTRIGNTVSPGAFHRGFHPCGLTGTFGAAAAAGKMLDLDTEQFVSALGLAGSQAAGLMASQFGAMAKRFHSGKAAQNGIIAAAAAREGLTGVRNVLEAPYGGFCSTYSDSYDLDKATDQLGSQFEMRHNGFKQYSSLASSQTSVDALRTIRERDGVKGEDVAHVLIETTEVVHRHCGWPYVPAETITAQMNLPYTAAVTLLDGTAFVDQYTDDRLRDPKILDLADRVEVVIDPEIDGLGLDEMRAVRVTVTTRSGNKFQESVLYRSGHYKNPLTDQTLKAKFHDLASRVITAEAADAIDHVISNLEREKAPAPLIGHNAQRVRT